MAKQNPIQSQDLAKEEKLAVRREKVRLNVRAFRERQKQKTKSPPDGPRTNGKWNTHITLRWIPERRPYATSEEINKNNKNRKPKRTRDAWESEAIVKKETSHHPSTKNVNVDPCLVRQPDPEIQYTYALLDQFLSRFLPCGWDKVPSTCRQERLAAPCASWLLRAFHLAFYKEQAAIKDMMRTISLGLLAMENRRGDLWRKSLLSYRSSLTEVRRHIVHVGRAKIDPLDLLALILSCHVAAMYELAVNSSLVDMIHHIDGIAALILHAVSDTSYLCEVLSQLIEEFRIMELCFCFTMRRTSVLVGAQDRAAQGASPTGPGNGISRMGMLIGIADQICVAMVKLDGMKPLVATDPTAVAMLDIIQNLHKILDDLEVWKHGFLNYYGSAILHLEDTSSSESLEFLSLTVASTWCYSLAYKLYALDTLMSAVHALSQVRENGLSLAWSSSIFDQSTLAQVQANTLATGRLLLRSLPWFYQKEIGITGRTLSILPLASVWRAFSNEVWHDSAAPIASSKNGESAKTGFAPELLSREMAAYEQLALNAKAFGLPIFSEQEFVGHPSHGPSPDQVPPFADSFVS